MDNDKKFTQEKTRDELVKELEEQIKSGNIEYMNEIAMPGMVRMIKTEDLMLTNIEMRNTNRR